MSTPERSPDRRSGEERRTHQGSYRDRDEEESFLDFRDDHDPKPDRRSDSVPTEAEASAALDALPDDVEGARTVRRTPIADALHEAYMKGFNDATMRPGDPMDEDAFTEAGIALSRMYTRLPEPGASERGLREALEALNENVGDLANSAVKAMVARALAPTPEHGDDDGE